MEGMRQPLQLDQKKRKKERKMLLLLIGGADKNRGDLVYL